eukprot:2732063-Amphidinium_carterae.1
MTLPNKALKKTKPQGSSTPAGSLQQNGPACSSATPLVRVSDTHMDAGVKGGRGVLPGTGSLVVSATPANGQ